MNQAYKLVWNTTLQAWTVASELARGNKKSSGKAFKLAVLLASGLATGMAYAVPAASALPSGENVASGSATFDRTVSNQLTVTQDTTKAIINWNSFDVGSNGKVIFDQPDTSSIALNRVTSTNPTEIFGQVSANGQLFIVNPNGITFGAGSQVSASSLLASVLDISDSNFDADNFVFSRGTATGAISNAGTIEAQGILFLGPNISNSGTLKAVDGNITLVNVDDIDATTQAINQASTIAGVIKNSGSIQATNLSNGNGQVLLYGDTSQAESRIELSGSVEGESTSIYGQSITVPAKLELVNNSLLAAQDAININADVDVTGTGGLSLYSNNGYLLNQASKVNLLGSNAAFAVNGDTYTVISDATQLQSMNGDLSGKYVLATDIDAINSQDWDNGRGFAPVGDAASAFSGVLEGLGHQVDKLSINRPTTDNVGLFGITDGSVIQNIGLTNLNVLGRDNVGGMAGVNKGSIGNAYVTGTIAAVHNAGGLAGVNDGTISNAYATSSINATGSVAGGMAGSLGSTGSISNAYASGVVTGGSVAGGLVGESAGTISNTYASGLVTGTSTGGLVASVTDGLVDSSYWNTDSTGQATSADGTGLSTAAMHDVNSFSGWDIDNQGGTGTVWRIYQGQTSPLLRSFLKPLSVDIHNTSSSKTYDGLTVSGVNYTVADAQADLSKVNSNFAARNAGTYSYAEGLSSGQTGYDLIVANDATLTINKKTLTITAEATSKVYDGKLTSNGKPVVAGRVRGDSIVGLTQSYADKNAGTGKTINVNHGYTIRDGNNGDNYSVVLVQSHDGVITPKALTISTVANTKVYDGGLTSANKPSVAGLVSGDRVTGLFQQYETKTVGTGKKLLIKAGYVVQDGNSGGNYTVAEQTSTDGVITAH